MPDVRESCLIWKILVGYPKLGRGSLITQGVFGLVALVIFMLNSAVEQFLPDVCVLEHVRVCPRFTIDYGNFGYTTKQQDHRSWEKVSLL